MNSRTPTYQYCVVRLRFGYAPALTIDTELNLARRGTHQECQYYDPALSGTQYGSGRTTEFEQYVRKVDIDNQCREILREPALARIPTTTSTAACGLSAAMYSKISSSTLQRPRWSNLFRPRPDSPAHFFVGYSSSGVGIRNTSLHHEMKRELSNKLFPRAILWLPF